jgi:Bacterial aa3 type cytochrome c oxidase subunit IV
MAESSPNSHAEAPGAGADMAEHVKTYQAFLKGTKWSIIGIIIVAALLAIFRTHNGM